MKVEFIKSAFQEKHYPPPDRPEIAFGGKSNVGKSSLLNVLVNRRKMARTSGKPGRTQALNFFTVDDRLYLVDLPGYGYARVPPRVKESWGKMVETYLRNRANLKAVVVILDIRRNPSQDDRNLIEWLHHYGIPSIIVATKADKLSRQQSVAKMKEMGTRLAGISEGGPTLFSAKTRQGREELWERIERAIESGNAPDHRP
jgi:GTP-binding protein